MSGGQGEEEGTVRAFVAVELPQAVKIALKPTLDALAAERIRGLRTVRAESAHITLRFLGDVPSDRLVSVVEALSGAARCVRPFRLRLGDVGSFPSSGAPSVLWIGLSGGLEEAGRLYEAVTESLAALDWPAEGRRFSPHITLARLASGASRPARRGALRVASSAPPQRLTFDVRSVCLMRSRLERAGARYDKLTDARLGRSGGDA